MCFWFEGLQGKEGEEDGENARGKSPGPTTPRSFPRLSKPLPRAADTIAMNHNEVFTAPPSLTLLAMGDKSRAVAEKVKEECERYTSSSFSPPSSSFSTTAFPPRTATSLLADMRSGKLTSVDVLSSCISRGCSG